jgi:hypothetical protein
LDAKLDHHSRSGEESVIGPLFSLPLGEKGRRDYQSESAVQQVFLEFSVERKRAGPNVKKTCKTGSFQPGTVELNLRISPRN